jgi:ubiquinol-cytochrome c reductase iron-sulfur subunit
MSEQQVDTDRRRFLTVATSAAGGVAVAGVATPWVLRWKWTSASSNPAR